MYTPTELVQYTQGEFKSHGLAISLAYAVYLSGEEMCLLLVQMISTCFCGASKGRGGGELASCGNN